MEGFSEELKAAIRGEVIPHLSEREQVVLEERFLGERKKTIAELRDQLGVSIDSVRRSERHVRRAIGVFLCCGNDSLVIQEAARRGVRVGEMLTPRKFPLRRAITAGPN